MQSLIDLQARMETLLDRIVAAEAKKQEALEAKNLGNFRHYIEEIKRLNADKQILQRAIDREIEKQDFHAFDLSVFDPAIKTAAWNKDNRADGRGAFPHQISGAAHLAAVKQGLLGDKRGLGKTLTSLAWTDLVSAKRALYLCPSDAIENVIRESKLWTPHLIPIRIGGWNKNMREFIFETVSNMDEFMLVGNYEMWRRDKTVIDWLINVELDTLIMDESHRIKTLKTASYRGVRDIRFGLNKCPTCVMPNVHRVENNKTLAVCKTCDTKGIITDFCSIENVLCMTGTPILNRPQELYPQLSVLDPLKFRSEENFIKDFCRKTSSGRWTWKDKAEKRVVEAIGPRYLARDRKTAGVIIPPVEHVLHTIPMVDMETMYPKQFKAYQQARDYAQIVLDDLTDDVMAIPEMITVILRLRQVLTWPNAIKMDIKDDDGNIIRTIKLNAEESIKLDLIEDQIRELNDEGERVVLFSQFRDPLHILQERLGYRTAIYDGSTHRGRRNEIQLDFDVKTAPKNPQWDNVLCNYKAAGEALNLNAASQMIILDEEWNPGRQSQAYGRVDRLGQTRDTQIHTYRVENSIDDWLADLIDQKRDMITGFESSASARMSMLSKLRDALRDGKV